MFTKESLTPVLKEMFVRVRAQLPEEIAQRLKPSSTVKRHGTFTSVLQFNAWDRYQTNALHRDYFNYNLVFDPHHCYSRDYAWYLQWWVNGTRLYHHRDEILATLTRAMRSDKCPSGFAFGSGNDCMSWITKWHTPRDIAALVALVEPLFVRLISAMHPILIPIVDSFTYASDPLERAAIIVGRQRAYKRHSDAEGSARAADFRRAIPLSWKRQILDTYQGLCARCEKQLTTGDTEFHHIIPVRDGGTHRIQNFKPFCVRCHDQVHREMP